jgi:hypothetical protein
LRFLFEIVVDINETDSDNDLYSKE